MRGACSTNSLIKFNTRMLKASLCDYGDAYIVVKETIIAPKHWNSNSRNNRNKEVVFKSCAPFTDCISEKSNTQIDNGEEIHVVMNIYIVW